MAAVVTIAMLQQQEIVAPRENEAEDIHPQLLDFVLRWVSVYFCVGEPNLFDIEVLYGFS